MDFEEIGLYRIIHIENMPHILEYGITHKNSANSNPEFIAIGDVSLIDARSNKSVVVDNGNLFNTDADSIILGEFTPFYFGVRMPMLYVIQMGGNFVQQRTPPEDIVYVVCFLKAIVETGLLYYFSDGHATDNLTTFYSADKISEISNIVSLDSVRSRYWGGEENLNVRRKKQAEFLVKGDIPVNCIRGYGVYNNTAKDKLINLGIGEQFIKVIPQSYF
jgi:hypothetical protein